MLSPEVQDPAELITEHDQSRGSAQKTQTGAHFTSLLLLEGMPPDTLVSPTQERACLCKIVVWGGLTRPSGIPAAGRHC